MHKPLTHFFSHWAGLVWGILDLVVENGEVQGETESETKLGSLESDHVGKTRVWHVGRTRAYHVVKFLPDGVSGGELGHGDIARGLVNYNWQEAVKIIGKNSESIETLLGYRNEEEMIHRDNLVLTLWMLSSLT